MNIREYKADAGYCDISKYTLDSLVFFKSSLDIKFISCDNSLAGFVIRLENAIAYNSSADKKKFSIIRIDNEGSSYGLDIAVRSKQSHVEQYMALYIFEERQKPFVFRGLAEKISIFFFDEENKIS